MSKRTVFNTATKQWQPLTPEIELQLEAGLSARDERSDRLRAVLSADSVGQRKRKEISEDAIGRAFRDQVVAELAERWPRGSDPERRSCHAPAESL